MEKPAHAHFALTIKITDIKWKEIRQEFIK